MSYTNPLLSNATMTSWSDMEYPASIGSYKFPYVTETYPDCLKGINFIEKENGMFIMLDKSIFNVDEIEGCVKDEVGESIKISLISGKELELKYENATKFVEDWGRLVTKLPNVD
jgi:hypothetical protein